MKIRPSTLLFAIVAAALLVWALGTFTGEEGKVRRQLDRLGTVISKSQGENALATVDKASQLIQLFSDDLTVDLGPYNQVIADQRQLTRAYAGFRQSREDIRVGFSDTQIELGDPLPTASMTTTATLSASGDGGGRGVYRLALRWRKVEGDWRIEHLEILEVLDGIESFL
ncbi:MAG: nuclear transport factor 2 family protein [Acidobacteriota bacterium]